MRKNQTANRLHSRPRQDTCRTACLFACCMFAPTLLPLFLTKGPSPAKHKQTQTRSHMHTPCRKTKGKQEREAERKQMHRFCVGAISLHHPSVCGKKAVCLEGVKRRSKSAIPLHMHLPLPSPSFTIRLPPNRQTSRMKGEDTTPTSLTTMHVHMRSEWRDPQALLPYSSPSPSPSSLHL